MPSITHEDLYTEVRAYLLGLFDCEVVQGRQNGSPLPNNGILMTILFSQNIGTSIDDHDEALNQTTVLQAQNVMLQLDFFGEMAQARSTRVSMLWRNEYTTERLKLCQPLYCNDPKSLDFINEQDRFEDRWMIELYLQYNPQTSFEQTFLDRPILTINKLGD
ncbi:hypothetical protein RMB03_17405 [Acinetobacter sp. V91_7]|uniref:phage neck terminator protein n=1 Tax=unclassified Acinetobacter TaxID=196816 RepID=UPI00287CE5E8|nr:MULTISPECIES: hypothetical protein [unclassified Acinetobacter]MDS7935666.1 hypothetical protein [Acinetobacter sp. V91_4B]MDS7964726.1 hypothetical protein [Acinetobacter sp. V91_7]MDS8025579.1 hypothetical protein [Acinetobacter sp. V91_13]